MNNSCLILIAHGSRDPKWGQPFEELLQKLRSDLGCDQVYLAYMENSHPLLPEVVCKAVAEGSRRFRILPLLMSSGIHMAEDIPAQAAELSQRYPQISIDVMPPIGSHPSFAGFLLDLVKESVSHGQAAQCGNCPRA
jgi:sirohydrochlorin cobaltochelatase